MSPYDQSRVHIISLSMKVKRKDPSIHKALGFILKARGAKVVWLVNYLTDKETTSSDLTNRLGATSSTLPVTTGPFSSQG